MHCARDAICAYSHDERRELESSLQPCFPDIPPLDKEVIHEILTIPEASFCRLI
jgi:hypothetical protein